MTFERMRWHDWEVVRCVARDCELLVGISAGPRVLSLRHQGRPNLLYRDTRDFRVGDWRMHGGHRFSVAPESAHSYHPDNEPCRVEWRGGELCVSAASGPMGLQRTLRVAVAAEGDGFDLDHVLTNGGDALWQGALWGITCVAGVREVLAPLGEGSFRLWPGSAPEPWRRLAERVLMRPDGSRGKAGWYSPEGWVAASLRDATLVVQCPDVPPAADCVDGGCNIEVFTGADYVELETLSGRVGLAPGATATHRQRWRVLSPKPGGAEGWPLLERVGGRGMELTR